MSSMDRDALRKSLRKLQSILIKNHSILRAARAHDAYEYEKLRGEVFQEPVLREILPEFLEDCTYLDDFLDFRAQISNHAEFIESSLKAAFAVLAGAKSSSHNKSSVPILKCSLSFAQEKIDGQISLGREILNRSYSNSDDIETGFDDVERWTRVTHALIAKLFGDTSIADEFSEWIRSGFDNDVIEARMNPTFRQQIEFLRGNISPKINRLVSIRERLELYAEDGQLPTTLAGCVGEASKSKLHSKGNDMKYRNQLSGNKEDSAAVAIDFVIITALEEEFDAVCALLTVERLPPSPEDTRTYFSSSLDVDFPGGLKGTYSLILMCLHSMGRVEAANATNDVIRRFSPQYVLLVGIAGGIEENEVSLGDILIANQVVDFENQKVLPDSTKFRFTSHNVDPRLLNSAGHYKVHECLALMKLERPAGHANPKRHLGPIATGDKVVAQQDFLRDFLECYPKAIAVEMESGGVASAAFKSSSKPGFFMIRATSDLADHNKDKEETKLWRSYACELAACYAIGFLKSGPAIASRSLASMPIPNNNEELNAAIIYQAK
jgi:nucleoside phosphorylase